MIAEELQIVIDAKVSAAVRDLKLVNKTINKTSSVSKKLTTVFKQLAGPFALGAVLFTTIRISKELSNMARDAEETADKFDVVFSSIKALANAAADELADSYGIAKSTSRELLSSTGDLLVGFGFTEKAALDLAKQTLALGSDLASMQNFAGGAKRATDALNKALVGESESVKALGIVIRQDTKAYQDLLTTIQDTKGVTLLQAKALAALQIATEQSGKAIGNVALTWDSTANVQKRLTESTKELKEELGESINVGLTPLLAVTEKIVRAMADWVGKQNDVKELLLDLKNDTLDTDTGLQSLNDSLEILENRRLRQGRGGGGVSEQLNAEIAAVKRLIDKYDLILESIKRRQESTELYSNNTLANLKLEEKVINANTEAYKSLLTEKDKRLDAIEDELKSLSLLKTFAKEMGRDWQGLEGVIVALLKEKVELLKDGNTLVEKEIRLYKDLAEINIQNLSDLELRVQGYEGESAVIEQLELDYKSLAKNGLGAFASAFKEVGEGNISLWEGIKQGSKDAMSAILEGLALEATSRAAIALFSGNFVSAAGFTAAATAAYAASGVVQGFGSGTDFTTTGPKLIMVGESGKERVRVDPQPDNRSRNGGNIINIYGDIVGAGGKEEFIQEVIDGINGVQRTRTA